MRSVGKFLRLVSLVVSSILGIGVLELPGALAGLSTWHAILLILTMAIINLLIAIILVRLSTEDSDHIPKALGSVSRTASLFASLGVLAYTLGATVSYVLIATNSIGELTGAPHQVVFWLYIALLVVITMTWRKTPKVISGFLLLTTALAITLLLGGIFLLATGYESSIRSTSNNRADLLKAISILSFAYYGHTSVLTVKKRGKLEGRGVEGIVAVSWIVVGVLYLVTYLLAPRSPELMSKALSMESTAGTIIRIYAIIASTGGFLSYSASTIDSVMDVLGGGKYQAAASYAIVLAPPILIAAIVRDVFWIISISGSLGAGMILLSISFAGLIKLKGIMRVISVISATVTALVTISFLLNCIS